jgi:hypothetical protein
MLGRTILKEALEEAVKRQSAGFTNHTCAYFSLQNVGLEKSSVKGEVKISILLGALCWR